MRFSLHLFYTRTSKILIFTAKDAENAEEKNRRGETGKMGS